MTTALETVETQELTANPSVSSLIKTLNALNFHYFTVRILWLLIIYLLLVKKLVRKLIFRFSIKGMILPLVSTTIL